MKHLLVATLLSMFGFSAGAQVFWSEDFETDGAGTRYTLGNIDDEFDDGGSDYYGISDSNGAYSGQNGTFFYAGEDINASDGNGVSPKEIIFNSASIVGVSTVRISGLFGARTCDQVDYLRLDYRVDGGTWEPAIWFQGLSGSNNGAAEDTDFNMSADGTTLSTSLASFSTDISVSGSTLELRTVMNGLTGGSGFGFDFLQFDDISGAAVCTAGVSSGSATCDSVTAAVDTYTATFAFTNGSETEALTVSSDNGTADVASISSDGTITVTGATEGVDVNLTLTNTNCSLMATVSAASCVPAPMPQCGPGETSLAFDSFEGGTTASVVSPATYNAGGDVWGVVSSLNAITSAQGGSDFWGMSDLANSNGGTATGVRSQLFYDVSYAAASYGSINLSFYYNSIGFDSSDEIGYDYSFDGGTAVSTNLSKDTQGDGGWVEVTLNIPVDPASTDFQLELWAIDNGSDWAGFDEVNICGSSTPACTATLAPGSAVCDSVTAAVDTYTATFSFLEGSEIDPFSISADNGTATVISGSIIVTGASEGTDVTVTATNANCSLMATVSASTCVPLPDLVITEIMYNSVGTDDEWIEICNNGATDVPLVGLEILVNTTLEFTFPGGTPDLTAGSCITVSLGSDGDGTFNEATCPFTPDYGIPAGTNNSNALTNSSRTIFLNSGATTIDQVEYFSTDGANDNGASLHVVNINADNSATGTNWQEVLTGGSPGNNSLISNCAPTNTFVEFSQSVLNVNEGDGTFTVCLSITNPDALNLTDALISINASSSAISPDDYDEDGAGFPFFEFGFSKDYVVFDPGVSADQCFDLFLIDDLLDEGQETIVLELINANISGGNGAIVGANNTLTINIADNDAPVVTPCTDLFISEYIEGGSNNKCLEIYNPSAVEVDMAAEGYALYRYGNGAATPSDTLMLQGSLCPGAVYVVCNSGSAASFLAQTDTTHSVSFFNGDDAIQLVKGAVHGSAFGSSVDVIGQIGVDPGAAWTGTGCSTANNTLVRKSTIELGDADGSDAFDPSLEWDCFAQDTDTELGGHTSTCFTPAACMLSIADGGNQSACDPGTNTYTNDVILTYTGDPGCGTIMVNGQEFAIGVSPQTVTLVGLTADGLDVDLSASFSADGACSASQASAFTAPVNCLPVNTIVINEVDYDQPESGDPAEFIELYNAGASAVDLDAYQVRLINGSGPIVYNTIDLPAVSLAAGDYYVIGSAIVPNVDQIEFSGNDFQNGAPDGVELVFTGTQVDALSYEGSIAGIVETAGAPADPGGSSATGLSRIANGVDTDDNSLDFVVTCITPGEANIICAVNDNCDDAISLGASVFGVSSWSTHELGAQESMPSCAVGADADDDIWFSFQASSSNDAIIARDPAGSYDVVIEVFDGCGGSSLGCFNNYGAGELERAVPGGLTTGNTYFFRVYDVATGASASTDVQVMVKSFEDSELHAPYCNVLDYDLSESVYAERDALGQLYSNPSVPVTGYEFRFQEQGGGLDVIYSHPNLEPYASLGQVNGLEYGKTYDVSVRHRVKMRANGMIVEFWSDFGTSCPVGLISAPPATQVQDLYCLSGSDFFLADIIKADQVPGATQYRFTFVGGGETIVETTSSYGTFLYNVGTSANGLKYGEVYSVSVEVNVNGIWSVPGTACSIAMAPQPEPTSLQGAYCLGTYAYPQNPNYVLAEPVLGAEYYEWRFTPVGGGVAQTDITSGVSLQFHTTSLDLSAGGDWDVEVRAYAGSVLGDYGASCSVTINTAPGIGSMSDELVKTTETIFTNGNVSIYPNPSNGSEFRLTLNGIDGNEDQVEVTVMDMTGKIIEVQSFSTKGEEAQILFRSSETLPAGTYLIRCTADTWQNTTRLIVR